ncbi:hypothetical protein BU17DRAFT_76386 [Hysterangium stoloniferum]|nr:hypothetical protein BU17DRAFT_76386 [Hysterangium stoloniferum]
MAQPSSSHHRGERERERSHHHHRTISSTTLLLVLSLILAVLAVMLSLPSTQGVASGDGSSSSVWGYLSPKRSQALVSREHAVAVREAEVAHREAEILAGAVGGVTTTSCPPVPSCPAEPPSCPPVPSCPADTPSCPPIPLEVEGLSPPGWWRDAGIRVEEVLDREARVSDREKEVGRREETIGRRETDVSRRETWIMEQLIAIGNEPGQTVEEEIIYETPAARRKPPKEIPYVPITETFIQTVTQTIPPMTQIEIHTEILTVTVPPAAHTRVAARPAPEEYVNPGPVTEKVRPTTAVEVVVEESLSLPTPEVVAEEVEEITEEGTSVIGEQTAPTPNQEMGGGGA